MRTVIENLLKALSELLVYKLLRQKFKDHLSKLNILLEVQTAEFHLFLDVTATPCMRTAGNTPQLPNSLGPPF